MFIFGKLFIFLYVLDIAIDVTRNGNNLKLKVKSEFPLSMGLMLNNHSNPYIHSTTILCDSEHSVSPCLLVHILVSPCGVLKYVNVQHVCCLLCAFVVGA